MTNAEILKHFRAALELVEPGLNPKIRLGVHNTYGGHGYIAVHVWMPFDYDDFHYGFFGARKKYSKVQIMYEALMNHNLNIIKVDRWWFGEDERVRFTLQIIDEAVASSVN